MIAFKPGVTCGDPPTPCQVRILGALDRASLTINHPLTVTAGRNDHRLPDPHARGLAVDVRANDLTDGQILALLDALGRDLGPSFTVLYESPTRPAGVLASVAYVNPSATGVHCHVQLKKGLPAEGWL
jgi:hypothetical protein